MKKLLIPTDFSQNAKKATDYALSLFDQTELTVTLLNVFYIPYASGDVAYTYNDITRENAQQLFKKEQERIREKFPHLKATIETTFQVGDVVNVVCMLEKDKAYDLIVMGTKGASGLAEVFVGSRTASMIKNVETPVLAIPEGAEFESPKRILFAADKMLIDREVNLDILKEIANIHHSAIDALHISDSDENKEIIERFIDYELDLNFVDIPHELKMERGTNVEDAIQKYVENYPVNLVAMITTRGSIFHNIFHESVTKQVAMHTKMPLLVMHTNLKED